MPLQNAILELERLRKKYSDIEIIKPIKSGKEASVWLVASSQLDETNKLYALKVYKENHLKSSNIQYIQGKHFRERSHKRAVAKRTKYGKELIQRLWTQREYYMLEKFHKLGAQVPKVYAYTDNAILMEYFGDINYSAPKLIETKLDKSTSQRFYLDISKSIEIFFENGVVHGDLSPHNILVWENRICIIDFPQAIDIRKNENWEWMYERDLENIRRFFN